MALPAGSLHLVPFRSRSSPAVLFSGLDGVKTVDGLLPHPETTLAAFHGGVESWQQDLHHRSSDS
jgi:hypothetical protein